MPQQPKSAVKERRVAETPTGWQDAFSLAPVDTQKQVYAFESALRLFEGKAQSVDAIMQRTIQALQMMGFTVGQSIEAEHHLKAAIVSGWVEAPECAVAEISPNGTGRRKTTQYLFDGVNVDDLHPGKVRWYGGQVWRAYQEAIAIPDPNL